MGTPAPRSGCRKRKGLGDHDGGLAADDARIPCWPPLHIEFPSQVVKAIRQGDTGAISKRMYIVTVTAFVLWIAYGFVIGALPLVIFNSLSLLLSGTILFLKIRNDRRAA